MPADSGAKYLHKQRRSFGWKLQVPMTPWLKGAERDQHTGARAHLLPGAAAQADSARLHLLGQAAFL